MWWKKLLAACTAVFAIVVVTAVMIFAYQVPWVIYFMTGAGLLAFATHVYRTYPG